MKAASDQPSVVILAGPNGAGKSTAAPYLLRDALQVDHFVNADAIASGLSAYAPEHAALAAGRIMLQRLHDLAAARSDFAFETTLATRSFAPWLRQLRDDGYLVHLIFLALPSPEVAIERVARRVLAGGHHVPDSVVTRRFYAGIRNLLHLYRPILDRWRVYNNDTPGNRRLVARGGRTKDTIVADAEVWTRFEIYGDKA